MEFPARSTAGPVADPSPSAPLERIEALEGAVQGIEASLGKVALTLADAVNDLAEVEKKIEAFFGAQAAIKTPQQNSEPPVAPVDP